MSFAFDLSSYEDVRGSADKIYGRLSDGSMPCDGNWSAEHVQRFRTWIDTGCAPEGRAAASRRSTQRLERAAG
jgi:hypothetical protein